MTRFSQHSITVFPAGDPTFVRYFYWGDVLSVRGVLRDWFAAIRRDQPRVQILRSLQEEQIFGELRTFASPQRGGLLTDEWQMPER